MNNLSIAQNTPLTMSSREIANLTGKRHDSVMRTIENLNMKGLLECPQFVETQNEQNKQMYMMANLEKTDSFVLIARLSPEFTKAVVDRWQELESNQPKLPQTFAEALQLAADQAKQLELAAPKVAFVDNFVEVGTTKTLRETAKILKYPERKMIQLMIEDKVLYRQSGNLLPYQARQAQGLFEVKTGERNGHAYTQTRVTTKGLEWLGQRYASDLMGDK